MSTVRHGLAPRGFTLLELLVVIVLAGIVGGLALPRIRQSNEKANLRNAREVVTSHLLAARRTALLRNSSTQFVVAGDSLVSVTMGDAATVVVAPFDVESDLGARVTLENAPVANTIRFDKRGMIRNNGGTMKVLLQNNSGYRDSVCVSGAGLVMRGSCQ